MVPRAARRFRFRGSPRHAGEGETVLTALAREGIPSVVRSIRYHRPRAPFCGVGDCTGCLVRVNGQPNVRACRYRLEDGDVVRTENSWPSPRFDVLGAIDLLFSGGIDTLHGFRRPAWAARAYQRVVRRLAGYGRPADRPLATPAAPTALSAEVAVVGAGRSGRLVAEALLATGARPVLLERGFDAPSLDGATLLTATTAAFLAAPGPGSSSPFSLLAFDERGRGTVVRTSRVVVATGGYDAALLFGGSDRPGVLSADLALSWVRTLGTPPFSRAVLVGGGLRAAAVLERLGGAVCAVVAPGEIRPEVARGASERAIPLFPRSIVTHAIGRSRVRRLSVARRDGGAPFEIPCDAVVLAHRRLPNAQLLFQAGATRAWRADPGAYYPLVDRLGRTSVPGLFAIGSAGGLEATFGPRPDELAAGVLAPPASGEPDAAVGASVGLGAEGYYRELLAAPRRGKWVVCACEDVLLGEVETAVAAGFRGIEVVKRYTGVGTGLCQGRYCLPDVLLLLAVLEGRPPSEVGFITQRPPAVPTPLSALAALSKTFVGEVVE